MKTIVLYLGNRLECGGGKIKSQGNHLIQLFLRTWYHARRVLEAYMFHVKKCRPLKVNMETTNHPFRKEHYLNQTSRELYAFHVNLQGFFPVHICNLALLGGFNQPIWKICSSTWIITPRFGLKIKHIGNQSPSWLFFSKATHVCWIQDRLQRRRSRTTRRIQTTKRSTFTCLDGDQH